MMTDLGMFCDEFSGDLAAFHLARVLIVTLRGQSGFHGGFITPPPRGQENNGGQQVMGPQNCEQLGRWKFGKFQLHNIA